MRSMKGQFYDEQFLEFTGETNMAEGTVLDLTQAIGELDTTKNIEELAASNEHNPLENIDNTELLDLSSASAEEPVQFLENVYCLYQNKPTLMNYMLFNKVDHVTSTEIDTNQTEGSTLMNTENIPISPISEKDTEKSEESEDIDEKLQENRCICTKNESGAKE